MIIYVKDNICNRYTQVIAHQCNTIRPYNGDGVHDAISKHTKVYIGRENEKSEFVIGGKSEILHKNNFMVINLYGQIYPGGLNHKETQDSRLKLMESCLDDLLAKIRRHQYLQNVIKNHGIAFPCGMGSGIGGGKWSDYEKLIEKFHNDLSQIMIDPIIRIFSIH